MRVAVCEKAEEKGEEGGESKLQAKLNAPEPKAGLGDISSMLVAHVGAKAAEKVEADANRKEELKAKLATSAVAVGGGGAPVSTRRTQRKGPLANPVADGDDPEVKVAELQARVEELESKLGSIKEKTKSFQREQGKCDFDEQHGRTYVHVLGIACHGMALRKFTVHTPLQVLEATARRVGGGHSAAVAWK